MADNGDISYRDHLFTNKFYDQTKFVALILLPAIGSAYFALAGLLDLPGAEEVVGTIVIIDTFLGAVLGFSTKTYNESDAKYDGEIHLTPDQELDVTNVKTSFDRDALATKKEILVKVKKVEPDA